MDPKKIGKKIKLARVEHDMTQDQLAEAVQSDQKTISGYETGKTMPSIDSLERFVRLFKKPFRYFLDEE
jgi:transcriptional regulator with XRE-family HTH domain